MFLVGCGSAAERSSAREREALTESTSGAFAEPPAQPLKNILLSEENCFIIEL
jgi:hypothetical protein